MRRLPLVERRLERAGDDLLLPGGSSAAPAHRIRLGGDHARQLIEELPHVRRQRRAELFERALELVAERRAGERLEQRAAEVERAQLRQRQPGGEPLERLAVDASTASAHRRAIDRRRAESRPLRAPGDRGGSCAS